MSPKAPEKKATKKAPAKKLTVKKDAVKDLEIKAGKGDAVKGGGDRSPTWQKSCYC